MRALNGIAFAGKPDEARRRRTREAMTSAGA
jgi:hypothetical protein